MTEFILEWLNKELVLSKPIENIRNEFYNGYYFGEILYKLGHITKEELEEKFRNLDDKFSVVNNYMNTKRILTERLEFEVSNNFLKPVMRKEVTGAIQLIYKIKNASARKKINFTGIKMTLPKEVINKYNPFNSFDDDENEQPEKINKKSNNRYGLDKEDSFHKKNISNLNLDGKITENPVEQTERENGDSNSKQKDEEQLEQVSKSEEFFKTKTKTPGRKSRLITESIQELPEDEPNKFSYNPENKKEYQISSDIFHIDNFSSELGKIGFNISNMNMKMLDGKLNFDMSQDTVIKKIRENLKSRLEEKKKRSQHIQKNLRNELILSQQPKPTYINFLRKSDNPLIPKLKDLRFNFRLEEKKFGDSFNKRLEYERRFKKLQREENLYKKLNQFDSMVQQQKLKEGFCIPKPSILLTQSNQDVFQYKSYFKLLNKMSLKESLAISEEKLRRRKNIYPRIQEIVDQIIDMTFEALIYQAEKGEELMDVELYKNLHSLFINNQPLREAEEDDEAKLIKKKVEQEEEKVDLDKIVFSDNENYSLLNYVNNTAEWNSYFYLPPVENSHISSEYDELENANKIDFKYIIDNYDSFFEPTESQIRDAVIPYRLIKNYKIFEVMDTILESKFNAGLRKSSLTSPRRTETNNNINLGKWDYIPFKIFFIGYPLAGKKTLANMISEKYQGIKVITLSNIIEEKVSEWEKINEPLEKNPKFKTFKPAQVEQMKAEQQKKIDDFKETYDLIQPYLKYKENPSKENYTNELNQMFFNILVKEIEEKFPMKEKETLDEEIYKRQLNLSNLQEKKKKIEEDNLTAKKPNVKEIQNLEKEIDKTQNEMFNGFVVTDYPNNLEQCILLESYLTSYVDENSLPKSDKNLFLNNLSNIIDIRFKSSENLYQKKSGIDFLINLSYSTEEISNRFNTIKYDPSTKKLYTEEDIEKSGDKKIVEKLVSEIPNLNKERFSYEMENYNTSWLRIKRFYDKYDNFGTNNIKPYQNLNCGKSFEEEKSPEPENEQKQQSNMSGNLSNNINNNTNINNNGKESLFKIIDDKILNILFSKNYKKELEIFKNIQKQRNATPNEEEEDDDFNEEGDKEEINLDVSPKAKHKNSIVSYLNYEIADETYKEYNIFSDIYNKNMKYFFFCFSKIQNEIIERYDLIQNKFLSFINKPSKKKVVLDQYVAKYNSFFDQAVTTNFSNQIVRSSFENDIVKLNSLLWEITQDKKLSCIQELVDIKNSGFLEGEINKFYNSIINLFFLELEKFLLNVNFVIKSTLRNLDKIIFYNQDLKNDILSKLYEVSTKTSDITLYVNNIDNLYYNIVKIIFKITDNVDYMLKQTNAASSNDTKKIRVKRKKTTEADPNSTVNTQLTNKEGRFNFNDEVKTLINNEKSNFKFRVTFLRYFSRLFLEKLNKNSEDFFSSLDNWIILSVNLQNNSLNKIIEILRQLIEGNVKFIPSDNEIYQIPLDDFSETEDSALFQKINIEKHFNFSTGYQKKTSIINSINNSSQVEYSTNFDISNFNNKSISIEQQPAIDFSYNINSLNWIYIAIKNFEIEKNIVLYETVFENLCKNYFVIPPALGHSNRSDSKINITESDSIKDYSTGICPALRFQSFENYIKLINNFKEKDLFNKNKDEKVVYNEYINYGQLFTIIALLGVKVISKEEFEKMKNELEKHKVNGSLINKNHFMAYHFWFEDNTEYILGEEYSLKEFIFDIWKEDDGISMNFTEFEQCISIDKYLDTSKIDLENIQNIRYYDITF